MRSVWNSVADYIRECDKLLLLLCLAASGYGCVAVLSSTHYLGNTKQFFTQLITVFLGVLLVVVISRFDYNIYKKSGRLLPFFAWFR